MVVTPSGKTIYFGDNSMQKKTKKNPEPTASRQYRDDTMLEEYKDRNYFGTDEGEK